VRREDVTTDLSQRAFEFFFWFSRFEFALKENGFLKSHLPDASAKPGWDEFVGKWSESYTPSSEALSLINSAPCRQIVLRDDELSWRPVGLADCTSELAKVVRLVKTVRNNLFHGGKHGSTGWDESERMARLLADGKAVIDQLAELSGLQADYTRHY
jgi:hypothetical protein